MAIREKRSAYSVAVDRSGRAWADGNEAVTFDPEWTPEHLLLVAFARCCLGALAFHARRRSLELAGSATTAGEVGKRDDGTWGFLSIECRSEIELRPEPEGDELADLLGRAQRGCFIGGSLRPEPVYRWTVNGRKI